MPARLEEVIAIALLFSAVWAFNRWRQQQRQKALVEVARQLGLDFEAEDWPPRYPGPQLEARHFMHNQGQMFRNTMSGERSKLRASFFDHVIGGRSGHTDTIASFTQPIFLPEFTLTQKGILSAIGNSLLHRKIDFDSDPVFSERFSLAGSEENAVRELFTPDMREFLETIEPEWQIEGSGHTLFMYQSGYVVKPDEYGDFVDETTDMAKTFFSHCHLKPPAF
jgi:hypothetical protein